MRMPDWMKNRGSGDQAHTFGATLAGAPADWRGRAPRVVAVAGLIVLAVGVRVWGLGQRSVWVDEAFSLWLAGQSPLVMVEWVARVDQHPPLYYALLAAWVRVWGWSEVAARSLSVFFSLATIPWAYAVGRRAANNRAGLWLLAAVSLSPLHVRYAREARMYALLLFTVTLMIWAAMRLMSENGAGRTRAWTVCLAMAALGALYTHHTAWLSVAAVAAVLAVWAWREGAGFRRQLGIAGLLVLVGWLPWARAFGHQATGVLRRFWIPAPGPAALAELVHAFLAGYTPRSVPVLLFELMLVLLAARGLTVAWRHPGRRWPLAVLGAAALGPPVAALAVSTVRPVFQPRTLIGASVPFLAMAALGITSLNRTLFRRGLVVGWLALSLWGVVQVHTAPDPEPWRAVAAFVAPRVQSGDAILFHASWVQLPFDYYFHQYGIPVAEYGAPVDLFDRGELEPMMRPEDVPAVLSRLSLHSRVWLVYSHDWYTDPDGLVLQSLVAHFCQEGHWQWPNIRVFLFTTCGDAGGAALPAGPERALPVQGWRR